VSFEKSFFFLLKLFNCSNPLNFAILKIEWSDSPPPEEVGLKLDQIRKIDMPIREKKKSPRKEDGPKL